MKRRGRRGSPSGHVWLAWLGRNWSRREGKRKGLAIDS